MTATPPNTPRASIVHSLFVKCAAIVGLSSLLMAAVFSFIADRSVDATASGVLAQTTKSMVQRAALDLETSASFDDASGVARVLAVSSDTIGENSAGMIVVDENGAVMAQTEMAPEFLDPLLSYAIRVAENGEPAQSTTQKFQATPILSSIDNSVVGAVALVWNEAPAFAMVSAQRWENRFLALAALLVIVIVNMLVMNKILNVPLRKTTKAISDIADGEYDHQIPCNHQKDEIGEMARKLTILVETLRAGRELENEKQLKMEQQMAVVHRMSAGLDDLANGVLHHEINDAFPAEYVELSENYNRAVQGLRQAIIKVRNNAGEIYDNSNDIAAASSELSNRTETQAATLEQSAAALDQMLATVRQAADEAKSADSAVRSTREIVDRNGQIMQSAIDAMSEIEASSEKINDIISVIDDIAFQTNLLALNAGVEAARAGTSGKGFAVVATEVQGLAQRSALAAQQIKDLILSSETQVQNGVRLVQNAGGALQDVVSNVSNISTLVEAIAARAAEQADSLSELNDGVTNLDQVTQQNAAMVEQSAAASQMLREGATDLGNLVQVFDLGHLDGSGPTNAYPDKAA